MRWEYLVAVVISILIALLFFAMGRLGRHDAEEVARQQGYDKGYRKGQADGRMQVMQDMAANPDAVFHPRQQQKTLPRPNSVGTIRTSRARIRGDHRLPQDQPERGRTNSVVKPPPTRVVQPLELENNGPEWNGS